MDLLDELQSRLAGRNMSEVSRRSGVAYDLVLRLAGGKQKDIYLRTHKKMTMALDELDGEAKS